VVKDASDQMITLINDLKTVGSAAGDSSEQIAAVAEENSAATEQVSASSEEIAAQVEQVASGAESLGTVADELSEQVALFQLPEQTGGLSVVTDDDRGQREAA
jgi:methyl-accepting chemotaxis protein